MVLLAVTDDPFTWWSANLGLMVFCHVIALIASGIVIFTNHARVSSVITALLSATLFTALGIPYMSIEHKWVWTSLLGLSAVFGFGSMSLAYTAIRISETLQRRAETAASKWSGTGDLPALDDADRLGRREGA